MVDWLKDFKEFGNQGKYNEQIYNKFLYDCPFEDGPEKLIADVYAKSPKEAYALSVYFMTNLCSCQEGYQFCVKPTVEKAIPADDFEIIQDVLKTSILLLTPFQALNLLKLIRKDFPFLGRFITPKIDSLTRIMDIQKDDDAPKNTLPDSQKTSSSSMSRK